MENEIYFGLDLGTSNIGYAVTDQDYNVLKVSGKRALGVRVFSEANTAVDRRTQRSARRRLQRRKQRINLLQDLFNDEMNKVDCNFFRKLNENDRILDDKSYKTKYSLFNDDNYTDVEYYKQYPTIYHLRQEQLIKGETDIRKLYLSIHHIIKYRGHFLLDGDMQNSVGDIDNLLDYFNDINFNISQYNSELEVSEQNPLCDEYIVNKENIIKLKDIYQNDKQNKIEKKKTITALLQAKDKVAQSFIDSLFNSNIDIANFFGKGKYESEDFSTSKFTFSSGAYDEIILELEDKLNEYEINILKGLKSIYDYLVLSKLLKNEKYLSNAMVNIYNKHNQDLILLKALFKGHKNEYEEVFGESKEGKIDNYSKYVGGQKNKKKGEIYEKITDNMTIKDKIILLSKSFTSLW